MPGWGYRCLGTRQAVGGDHVVWGSGMGWHHIPPCCVMSLVTSSIRGVSAGGWSQRACCEAHDSGLFQGLSQESLSPAWPPQEGDDGGGTSHSQPTQLPAPCQAGKGAGARGCQPPLTCWALRG